MPTVRNIVPVYTGDPKVAHAYMKSRNLVVGAVQHLEARLATGVFIATTLSAALTKRAQQALHRLYLCYRHTQEFCSMGQPDWQSRNVVMRGDRSLRSAGQRLNASVGACD